MAVEINQVIQAIWNLNTDAEGLADDLKVGAQDIYSASVNLEPQQRALRDLQDRYELEESRLRSVETARYASSKSGVKVGEAVMTAGDAAGRKAQLDNYIATQAADTSTELGKLWADIKKKEVEVESLTAKVKDGERQQRAQLAVAELQGKRLEALGRIVVAMTPAAKKEIPLGTYVPTVSQK